mmetsp:Transcript_23568/g.27671  ORF Transcript_23568/g.27671 Transcript_23568/m.27671 type:complete len:232 (-) Transcript_23568:1133-1828(-)
MLNSLSSMSNNEYDDFTYQKQRGKRTGTKKSNDNIQRTNVKKSTFSQLSHFSNRYSDLEDDEATSPFRIEAVEISTSLADTSDADEDLRLNQRPNSSPLDSVHERDVLHTACEAMAMEQDRKEIDKRWEKMKLQEFCVFLSLLENEDSISANNTLSMTSNSNIGRATESAMNGNSSKAAAEADDGDRRIQHKSELSKVTGLSLNTFILDGKTSVQYAAAAARVQKKSRPKL